MTNTHQLLVRCRTGTESCDCYWLKALSVIFNICNNEACTTLSFALCQCLKLRLCVLSRYNDPSLWYHPRPICWGKLSLSLRLCSCVFISSFFYAHARELQRAWARLHTLVKTCAVLSLTTRCSSDSTKQTLTDFSIFCVYNGNVELANIMHVR